VARHYRSDAGRNSPVSTEITGYAVSAFVYLHSLSRDAVYMEAAGRAARFLSRTAWDGARKAMPFELDPPAFAYFFDCGIAVRGLLAAWRVTGEDEFAEAAAALGESMAADFACEDGGFHAILSLPDKRPVPPDASRWSASPGCYQLKSAMALQDLAEMSGNPRFGEICERALEFGLRSYRGFLPGHADPLKVMDRLHAFLYFLEGLLPRAAENRCAAAIRDGMSRVARALRDSLLRIKKYLGDPAYNFIVHTSPINGHEREDYHWHIEIMPKLVKVAGFEWGSGFYINPVPPDIAAQNLLSVKLEEK